MTATRHTGAISAGGFVPRSAGLRHTFCSHLAMRGAPAKAIQELAGHSNLATTYRYMHLSPAAREGAIRLLNSRDQAEVFGEIVETADAPE
jgi:integrase